MNLSLARVRALVAACALFSAMSARAVAVDPADFIPFAAGSRIGVLYLQATTLSGQYANGKRVDSQARLYEDVALLRYVAATEIGGINSDLQIVLPVIDVHGGGSLSGLGHARGTGDPVLVGTFYVVNNPDAQRYFAVNPYITVPVGEYHPNDPLNTGDHRWKGDMQFGFTQGFGPHLTLELIGDVQYAGANDQYHGASTLRQKPLYDQQAFVRWTFDPLDEVSLRLRRMSGGEDRVDGVRQHDNQNTKSFLVSYSRFFPKQKFQFLVQAGRDLSIENGIKEESRVQVRLAKMF
jgi:hypothetical protein